MIRVTVELISAIDEKRSRLLGVATIGNDLRESVASNGAMGSYDYRLSKWYPKNNQTWKVGQVSGFNRKTRGAWDLLYMVLRDAVGNRNKEEKTNACQIVLLITFPNL